MLQQHQTFPGLLRLELRSGICVIAPLLLKDKFRRNNTNFPSFCLTVMTLPDPPCFLASGRCTMRPLNATYLF